MVRRKKFLIMTIGTGMGKDGMESLIRGLIKSIESCNPDYIVFVVTEKSKKTLPEIEKKYSALPEHETILIEDLGDVNEVFIKTHRKIEELKRKGNVVVDFTSGTKAMSAGAVLAAACEGADISYISGKRVEGKVLPGTEMVLTYHPFAGMMKIQEKIGKELFNYYQFDASIKVFDSILDTAPSEEDAERIMKIKSIIEGYRLWDRFDHERAGEILLGIKEVPSQNKEFIGKIARIADKEPLYIADILNNSKRRYKEGKYDDAMARLYRVIELIAQYRLKSVYGIDSSNVEIERLPRGIREKYEKLIEDYYEDDRKKRIKLGLRKDYELLKDLGDEIGKEFYGNKRLQHLLSKRNESILAHGLSAIPKEVYEELLSITLEFARIAVPDVDVLMKKSEFPRIEELI